MSQRRGELTENVFQINLESKWSMHSQGTYEHTVQEKGWNKQKSPSPSQVAISATTPCGTYCLVDHIPFIEDGTVMKLSIRGHGHHWLFQYLSSCLKSKVYIHILYPPNCSENVCSHYPSASHSNIIIVQRWTAEWAQLTGDFHAVSQIRWNEWAHNSRQWLDPHPKGEKRKP